MAARPNDVRYTKTHEWVRLAGGVATMGITDFAATSLGDLVYVDLPAKGKKVTKGQSFVEIESVKAVAEVYAPLSGEVVEVNAGLPADMGPLSKDPYGTGWLAKIKVPASASVADLLDAAAYQKHLDAGGGAH